MSAQSAITKKSTYAQPENRFELAIERLRRATDTLEAAISRQDRESKSAEALEQELEVLLQDRSKLAQDLDQVRARASRLDAAGAEVSSRLDSVMSNIKTLLARA